MKVLRLCPESVYAELQIGVLKLTLGRHLDAIEHFRSVNTAKMNIIIIWYRVQEILVVS